MKSIIKLSVLFYLLVLPVTAFADIFTSMGTVALYTGVERSDKTVSKMLAGDKVIFVSTNAHIANKYIYHNNYIWSILDSQNKTIFSGSGKDLTGILIQKIITDTSRIFYEIGDGHGTGLCVFDKSTNMRKTIGVLNIRPDMEYYSIEVINGKMYLIASGENTNGVRVTWSSELFWDDNANWIGYKIPQIKDQIRVHK